MHAENKLIEGFEVTIESTKKADILNFMKDNEAPNVGQICSFYGMIYDPATETYSKYDILKDEFSFYNWNNGARPTFIPVALESDGVESDG